MSRRVVTLHAQCAQLQDAPAARRTPRARVDIPDAISSPGPCSPRHSLVPVALVAHWSAECPGHLGECLSNREQPRCDPASPAHLYPNGPAITIERLRQDDCRMTGGIASRTVGTYHPLLSRRTIALERRSCCAVR